MFCAWNVAKRTFTANGPVICLVKEWARPNATSDTPLRRPRWDCASHGAVQFQIASGAIKHAAGVLRRQLPYQIHALAQAFEIKVASSIGGSRAICSNGFTNCA